MAYEIRKTGEGEYRIKSPENEFTVMLSNNGKEILIENRADDDAAIVSIPTDGVAALSEALHGLLSEPYIMPDGS
jgi:hypothetical protein